MRPRLAMLAYACDPNGGGEHWLGWGWAAAASQFANVTLYTRTQAAGSITEHAKKCGIRVRFVDLSFPVKGGSQYLGDAGSWWRKIRWARSAASAVASDGIKYDIVHQTTFHTFRVPFYAAGIGIPSIWGPLGGGEHTPPGFDSFLGKARHQDRLRNWINKRWLLWHPVQQSLRQAGRIFVSNHTTQNFLPDFIREKSQIVPPNTLRDHLFRQIVKSPKAGNVLSLIYAGNCVASRCIPLVLQAIAKCENVSLIVAGTGPALSAWRHLSSSLGNRVKFLGQVSREQLMQLYCEADALIFPALRDSGGSSVLEAMSIGLPVICLDWGGPAEMVGESGGLKISVESPALTVATLVGTFENLIRNPDVLTELSKRGIKRAQSSFSWEAKRAALETACQELLIP